jgi:hypothetical protein
MIINNVKLVLENEVVGGSVEIQDGVIRAFAETQSRSPEAMDGEGGWLLPGLIELHTDNLDKFFTPRPKVDWPAHSAMSSHDALMVASGITTVLDAVAIGDVRDGGDRLENLEKMINAVEETQKRGLNRAEHRLHLRCELPHHTTLPLFEKLVGLRQLRRQANANAADTAVAVRVFVQILLMIVLGIIKRRGRGDFGGHMAGVMGIGHRLLESRQAVARGGVLLRGQRIEGRAVLGAVIVALAHALGRIVIFPENLEQLFIANDGRVVHHAHRFRVSGLTGANFAVGRVWGVTAGIARGGAINAG